MIWTLVFIAIIANAARESRYRSRLSTWLVGIALFFGGALPVSCPTAWRLWCWA